MYLKHKQATRQITAPQLEKRKWPLTWKSAVERSSRLEKSNSDTQTRSPKPEFIDASAEDLAAVCIHRTITFHYFITVWSMFLKCNNFVTAVLISTFFVFLICASLFWSATLAAGEVQWLAIQTGLQAAGAHIFPSTCTGTPGAPNGIPLSSLLLSYSLHHRSFSSIDGFHIFYDI